MTRQTPVDEAPEPHPPLAEIAASAGCTARTLRNYRKRGWDGDPATLDAWRAANIRQRGPAPMRPRSDRNDGVAPDASGPMDRALLRYREAKAREAELRTEELAARLVERSQVERLFVARVAEVRAALVHLPRQLARRLANQTAEVVEDELDAEIRKILERFARGDPVLEGARRKVARPRRA